MIVNYFSFGDDAGNVGVDHFHYCKDSLDNLFSCTHEIHAIIITGGGRQLTVGTYHSCCDQFAV